MISANSFWHLAVFFFCWFQRGETRNQTWRDITGYFFVFVLFFFSTQRLERTRKEWRVKRHVWRGGGRELERRNRDASRFVVLAIRSSLLHPFSTTFARVSFVSYVIFFFLLFLKFLFFFFANRIVSLDLVEWYRVSQAGAQAERVLSGQATAAQQRSHRDEHRAQIIATDELLEMPASPMNIDRQTDRYTYIYIEWYRTC